MRRNDTPPEESELPTRGDFLFGHLRRWQAARHNIKLVGEETATEGQLAERDENRRKFFKDAGITTGVGALGVAAVTAYIKGWLGNWFGDTDDKAAKPGVKPPEDAYIDNWDPWKFIQGSLEVVINWSRAIEGLKEGQAKVKEILEHPLNREMLRRELTMRQKLVNALRKMPPDEERVLTAEFVGFLLQKAIPKLYGIPQQTVDRISHHPTFSVSDFFFVDAIESAPETPKTQWFQDHGLTFYDRENRTMWAYTKKSTNITFATKAARDHGIELRGTSGRSLTSQNPWAKITGQKHFWDEHMEKEDKAFEFLTGYEALKEFKLDKAEAEKIKAKLLELPEGADIRMLLEQLIRISPSSNKNFKNIHAYVLCGVFVNQSDPALDKIRPMLKEIFENPEKYLID